MKRFGLLTNENDEKIVIDFCNMYYELHRELPNEIRCFSYLDYIKTHGQLLRCIDTELCPCL